MKSTFVFAALVAFAGKCAAVGVVGKAEGFGSGTTGGGSATPQYPADIAQLKTWLTDSVARVIVLDKEYVTPPFYVTIVNRTPDSTSLAAKAKSPRLVVDQHRTPVSTKEVKMLSMGPTGVTLYPPRSQ